MILRFSSGSPTLASALRKCSAASTLRSWSPSPSNILMHFRRLLVAQQPRVDEYAHGAIADGAIAELRGDGRVDAAREPDNDFALRRGRADPLCGLFGERGHVPVALAPADLEQEVAEELLPFGCVRDFGVELHAVHLLLVIGHRGQRHVSALGDDPERLAGAHRHGRRGSSRRGLRPATPPSSG